MSMKEPSTLGDYADICAGLPDEVATTAREFIAKKIKESPMGRDEPVIASPTQMMHLLGSLVAQDAARIGGAA